ncbi:hypothetical protein [Bavariicoccus seileri]|uniref:hypothetical protein n=1 Tax=Bavariicoccus seileri TaxID=549685 RepID=UPI0003B60B1D|nr:hypothetical protein [Bavariicoccus seileri]
MNEGKNKTLRTETMEISKTKCKRCGNNFHKPSANYCWNCGTKLEKYPQGQNSFHESIVFYSKVNNRNIYLFESNEIAGTEEYIDIKFKHLKPYIYALVAGVEIKLFKDQEV